MKLVNVTSHYNQTDVCENSFCLQLGPQGHKNLDQLIFNLSPRLTLRIYGGKVRPRSKVSLPLGQTLIPKTANRSFDLLRSLHKYI